MTLVTVPVTRVTRAAVADPAAVSDVGLGFTIPDNDGNLFVRVANPTAGDLTIAFTATATLAGELFPALSKVIAAGTTRSIGPFPPVLYNDDLGAVNGSADLGLTLLALGI
jgi:hypothetical protein